MLWHRNRGATPRRGEITPPRSGRPKGDDGGATWSETALAESTPGASRAPDCSPTSSTCLGEPRSGGGADCSLRPLLPAWRRKPGLRAERWIASARSQ